MRMGWGKLQRCRLVMSAAVLVLSGCGGGGGGDATSPAPALTFVASPISIPSGQSTTLTWSTTNATACTASGSWSGDMPTSGNEPIVLTEGNYIFVLTCAGAGGSVAKSTDVVVTGQSNSALSVSLSASPTSVPAGQTTTLTWSANNAQSCSASGAWSGNKASSGSETVTVSVVGDNSYTLTCSNGNASGSQTVVVTGAGPSVTLSATPTTVGIGQATTLSWSSANTQSCTASGGWTGSKATSGSEAQTVLSAGNNTYTLSCTGTGGAVVSSTATVVGVQPTLALSVFPSSVTVGQTATLTWTSTNTQSCTASGGWSGSEPLSGTSTFAVSAAGKTDYTLVCANGGGNATQTVSVTGNAVLALPPATAFQITVDHSGEMVFANGLKLPTAAAWSKNLSGTVSYALIADGLVFVTVSNSSGSGTRLFALDEKTGNTVWGPIALSGTYAFSNAAYESGKVFVVSYDGLLRSFDSKTGSAGWSISLPGQYAFSAPPTAYGGIVFVGGAGSGGTLYAVDETNGKVLWTQPVENGDDSSPAVTSSGAYVTYPCQAYDFSPSSGSPIWHQANGCEGGGGRTSTVKNGVFYGRYFSVSNNSLIYFNADTGVQQGAGSADTIPAITATRGFFMNSGTLQGADLSSGSVLWSYAGDGQLVTAPIVVNDKVFVGSSSGKVFAVDAATGALAWTGTTGAALQAPDEQNVSAPRTGLSAGEGMLLAPAGSTLTAWAIAQ